MKRKHPDAICEECPLKDRPHAPSVGPKDAKFAVVSRSPGYYEGRAGKPFSGPSGNVLNHLLKMNGATREETFLTNVVLCTHDETTPPPAAIKACSVRLQGELRSAETVIAAGSEALQAVLGRRGIDSSRAYVHYRSVDSGRESGDTSQQRVVVTNNPALVLRDDATFPNLVKDFRLAYNPRPDPILPEVEEVVEVKRGLELIRSVRGRLISADIETRSKSSTNDTLVSFNVSECAETAWVLTESIIGDKRILGELRSLLEDRSTTFIWHNGKFDCSVLRKHYGINARVDHDTMFLSYLLDERPGYHSLEYLLMDEFGWPNYSSKEIEEFKKGKREEVPPRFYQYAGLDAAGTFQLYHQLVDKAKEEEVYDVYENIMIPVCEVLMRAELHGIVFDVEAAANIYENDIQPLLESQRANLRELVKDPLLNPNSPQQVQKLYFDKWKVYAKAMSRPDKARSVDKTFREQIMEGNFKTEGERRKVGRPPQAVIDHERAFIAEFTREFHDYKSIAKQASTYLLANIVRAEKNPEHRLHTWFSEIGTESGRLSSKKSNLQNVTRPKEGLPNIRALFRPSQGRKLVSGDLSQAELRTVAVLSGDTNALSIYKDTTRSIHKEMAASFYGPGYTYEEYVKSKNINFGIIYDQGAFSFSQMYHMPQREAQDFINAWFARFPAVKDWQRKTWEEVRKFGHLTSPFGRRRRFHLITDENKDHSYKEAINFRPQSTANDITLLAAIELADRMDWERACIVVLVHDSIVADVDEDYVEEYSILLKECMQTQVDKWLKWDVPFLADVSIGDNWGEMEEIDVPLAA